MSSPARKPDSLARDLLMELTNRERQNTTTLAGILNASKRQVSDAAALLARKGLLKRPDAGVYELTRAGRSVSIEGVKVPVHRDTFRERAWRSMRIRRHFTIGDIVSDAARETEKDARNNATRYVWILRRAGYVRAMPHRQQGTALTSNGFKVFALVQDTGPRAPIWRQAQAVLHDFNLGEDIACAPR
jgi:DNA-binding Lrp family transcriptional regulator